MRNYLDYVRKFTLPEELVDDLTRKITRVNGIHVETAWLCFL